MNTRTGTGILQVAFGRSYVEEAIQSARSAKAAMPEIPIALITDEATPEAGQLFDQVIHLPQERPDVPEKFWGFYNKINGLQASPFTHTLFMDVDIHCVSGVEECFTMLQKKTMIAVPVPPRDRPAVTNQMANPLPPMNTGVLGYHYDRLPEAFFDTWKQLYVEHCPGDTAKNFGDQTIFRKLVWNQNIDILLLDYAYNFRFTKPAIFSGPVKLLHGRAQNAEYVGQFVNITTEPRIYLPHNALLVSDPHSRDWIIYPYRAPEEPSRLSAPNFSDAILMVAEENGIDEDAAAKVLAAIHNLQPV